MTPYEKFQIIFEKWLRFASKSVGHDILDKNFRPNLLTGMMFTLICLSVVFCFYTVLAFDSETAWKGATFLSLALQVIFSEIVLFKMLILACPK